MQNLSQLTVWLQEATVGALPVVEVGRVLRLQDGLPVAVRRNGVELLLQASHRVGMAGSPSGLGVGGADHVVHEPAACLHEVHYLQRKIDVCAVEVLERTALAAVATVVHVAREQVALADVWTAHDVDAGA